MALLVFAGSIFIFLALGVPVYIALGACAIALMFFLDFVEPLMMAQRMVWGVNNFVMMAIPFFIFAGEIMSKGGLGARLVQAADIIIGRIRGGLGYTNVLSSIMFAGLSGSAVADVAMSGSLLYPMMVKNNYKRGRAMGAICTSAIVSLIIPPSTVMIILGTTVGISITSLFMAGIIPGIMLGLALMVAWFFVVRIDGYSDLKKYSFKEGVNVFFRSIPAILMPIIIIGGIRFGVFTPTEAGVFSAVYAIVVCAFVYRELTWNTFLTCLVNTAKSTSVVMLIVATATAVSWLIAIARVPELAVEFFSPLIGNPLLLLLAINIFLILVGMVLDLTPAVLIFSPVLFPVIIAAGINPIAFGVIMILNLGLGLITPPIGVILAMGLSVSGVKYQELVLGTLPFLAVLFFMLFLFVFFPALILVPLGWLT